MSSKTLHLKLLAAVLAATLLSLVQPVAAPAARSAREKTIVVSEGGGLGRIESQGKLGAILRRDEGIVTLLDVKNPSSPKILGSYDDGATLSLDGDLAFSKDGAYIFYARQTEQFSKDGLHVLEVSDPKSPRLTAYFPMGGAYRVDSFDAGDAEYIYVLDATHGLVTLRFEPMSGQVIPVNIDPLPQLKVGGPASAGIFIDPKDPMTGTPLMYITTGKTGLQIYDLSDAAVPQVIATWDEVGLAEVEVQTSKKQRIVYAATEYWFDKSIEPRVVVLDASDLGKIEEAASFDLRYAADPQDRQRVQGMDIRGDRLYVAHSTVGVAVFPTDPDKPIVARWNLPTGEPTEKAATLGTPYAYDVEVVGDRIYVTDATTGQLSIFRP
ncbi:MAG: LVIVD repeat-containing protein [Actinomycetota bacterium]